MSKIPAGDLFDYQADILYTDTTNNPSLPASGIPALNKALKTKNKRMIGATNELLTGLDVNNTTVKNIADVVASVVGSPTDIETINELHKIDINTIKAIIKIYKMIVGPDLDNPETITDANIYAAINSLKANAGNGGSGGNDGSFLLSL